MPEKGVNAERGKERQRKLKIELGVRMSKAEYDYLESQRFSKPRSEKMMCIPSLNQIDPVWAEQQKRKESLSKYQEK